jgi:hypothetical protein
LIRYLSVCRLAERGVVRNVLETNESPGWWELGSGARANRESFWVVGDEDETPLFKNVKIFGINRSAESHTPFSL